MKKIFLILIFVIGLLNTSTSQEADEIIMVDLMSIELAKITDGAVNSTVVTTEGDLYIKQIIIPKYYNFDLVSMSVNQLIRSYNDVEHEGAWFIEDKLYFKLIRSNELLFLIAYSPKDISILISTFN